MCVDLKDSADPVAEGQVLQRFRLGGEEAVQLSDSEAKELTSGFGIISAAIVEFNRLVTEILGTDDLPRSTTRLTIDPPYREMGWDVHTDEFDEGNPEDPKVHLISTIAWPILGSSVPGTTFFERQYLNGDPSNQVELSYLDDQNWMGVQTVMPWTLVLFDSLTEHSPPSASPLHRVRMQFNQEVPLSRVPNAKFLKYELGSVVLPDRSPKVGHDFRVGPAPMGNGVLSNGVHLSL